MDVLFLTIKELESIPEWYPDPSSYGYDFEDSIPDHYIDREDDFTEVRMTLVPIDGMEQDKDGLEARWRQACEDVADVIFVELVEGRTTIS